MPTLPSLALLSLIACDLGGAPVDQLETLAITVSNEDMAPLSLAGGLAVTGSGADFTLTLEEQTITVHSPGGVDLSVFDGQEVTIAVMAWQWPDWPRSLALSDAGGLAYIADVGFDADAVNALLGEGVVSFGEEVGTDRDGTWTWSYRSLRLQTDDGAISLLPGDVETVTIGGVHWQATAIAAYQRDPRPSAALPGCPIVEDLLSYELLRVDAPKDSAFRVRGDGAAAAGIGCLD